MSERYRHTQVAVLMLAVLMPFVIVLAWWSADAIVILPLIAIILLVFATLTTAVSDQDVRVWFGVGLIRRRIALNRIASVRPVRNHWIYGWGVRLIPNGWLWNVSGLDAVELALVNGRRFRIGTDEPERLAAAIQGALRKP